MRFCLLLLVGTALPCPGAPARAAESLTVRMNARQPMSRSGTDDLAKLKKLASGVGWEFAPNRDTARALKALGMRYIRCINVDLLPGGFDPGGRFILSESPGRLDAHLEACQEVGANPHIVFGMSVPEPLRVSNEEVHKRLGVLGQQPGPYVYWNGDWARFKAHCKAYFDYVLVKKRFPKARFEVGNEPDIDGQFPRLPGPKMGMGSDALYRSYFEVYRHAAEAADEYEKKTGLKVSLGGPALAWAFSFKFGDFNWIEWFLKDCAARKVRLDFIGIHFYGNIASLDGRYPSAYPSYTAMLKTTSLTSSGSLLSGLAGEMADLALRRDARLPPRSPLLHRPDPGRLCDRQPVDIRGHGIGHRYVPVLSELGKIGGPLFHPFFPDNRDVHPVPALDKFLNLPAGSPEDGLHFLPGNQQVVEPGADRFLVADADSHLTGHPAPLPVVLVVG
ncbi:MAG: hypothetical protein IT210_17095 [Armatimonadetes bacterium]|nr:hypothetical protein [Armatimonadota bacterium]